MVIHRRDAEVYRNYELRIMNYPLPSRITHHVSSIVHRPSSFVRHHLHLKSLDNPLLLGVHTYAIL